MSLAKKLEQEGFEKGLSLAKKLEQEGFEKGLSEAQHRIAQEMLAQHADPVFIAKVTGLSLETVHTLSVDELGTMSERN